MNTIQIKTQDGLEECNLEELDRNELLLLRIEINEGMDTIKTQISEYNDSSIEYKKLNREWLHRANRALIHKKRDLHKVQAQLTAIKKDISIQHYFMLSAKELLPETDYQLVLDEAHQRMEAVR